MRLLVLTTTLLILLPACHSEELGRIDRDSISLTDFVTRLAQIPGFSESERSQQKAAALSVMESLVDDTALYLEARAFGVKVSEAQVDHALRQHEALLGSALLMAYTHQRGVGKQALRKLYERQLVVFEYLKAVQVKEKPFCEGLGVQSSQNCIMRENFMKTMRERHSVYVDQAAVMRVLDDLVGTG